MPKAWGVPRPQGQRLVEDEILAIDAAEHADGVARRGRGDRRRDERKVRARAADRPRPRLGAARRPTSGRGGTAWCGASRRRALRLPATESAAAARSSIGSRVRKRPHGEVADLRRTDQRRREIVQAPQRRMRIALVTGLVQPRLHDAGRRHEERDQRDGAQHAVDVAARPAADERAEQQQRRAPRRSRASPISARACRSETGHRCSAAASRSRAHRRRCRSAPPAGGAFRRDTAARTSRSPTAAAPAPMP